MKKYKGLGKVGEMAREGGPKQVYVMRW